MLFHETLHSGSVVGHEGFAVALPPWGFLCSFVVVPAFDYLVPVCFMCCISFWTSLFFYNCFLPYDNVPHIPVSNHSLGGRSDSGHASVYKDMAPPFLWIKIWLWLIHLLGHFSSLFLITCFMSALVCSEFHICIISKRCSDLFPHNLGLRKVCSVVCSSLGKLPKLSGRGRTEGRH